MDDPRLQELETLKAIFGDDARIEAGTFSGSVSIVVELQADTSVHLLEPLSGIIRESRVSYLPSISVHFQLPPLYPSEEAPVVSLECPMFTEVAKAHVLKKICSIWQSLRDQVLFNIVDFVQQEALGDLEALFGQSINSYSDPVLYQTIVDYDRLRKVEVFNLRTFTCEICQMEVKGDGCMEFDPCKHVFCRRCLGEFFTSLIVRGEVEKIHCPNFECTKRIFSVREKVLSSDSLLADTFNFEEFKTEIMAPPINLDALRNILDSCDSAEELFDKYVKLHEDHQHMLIAKLFPHRLVSCPREKCPSMIFREDMVQRLVICKRCDYAFCHVCRRSYHSDSIDCAKSRKNLQYLGVPIEAMEVWLENTDAKERSALRYKYGFDLMQKMSNEYLMDKLFNELLQDLSQEFSKCPTCDIVIQRMDGCNKMRCLSCYTFFCNICGSYLDHSQPYEHFNNRSSACYGKLFHGMPGLEEVN